MPKGRPAAPTGVCRRVKELLMSFGSGRSPKPQTPVLPSPIATPETLSQQAQGAGQEEKKRFNVRRGKRGTVFAGGRDLAPANTFAPALRQTL